MGRWLAEVLISSILTLLAIHFLSLPPSLSFQQWIGLLFMLLAGGVLTGSFWKD